MVITVARRTDFDFVIYPCGLSGRLPLTPPREHPAFQVPWERRLGNLVRRECWSTRAGRGSCRHSGKLSEFITPAMDDKSFSRFLTPSSLYARLASCSACIFSSSVFLHLLKWSLSKWADCICSLNKLYLVCICLQSFTTWAVGGAGDVHSRLTAIPTIMKE